jgi:hypothetical protein
VRIGVHRLFELSETIHHEAYHAKLMVGIQSVKPRPHLAIFLVPNLCCNKVKKNAISLIHVDTGYRLFIEGSTVFGTIANTIEV